MEPQPNGGRINMGAFGGTVQATISTVTIAHDQSVPQSFSVSQNYPNPFNAVTIIDVILPSSEDVDLEIYNIIGQRIGTLSYKMLPAGRHQIKIDGGNLASGVYIYRLLAGPHHDVKKMIVIK